MVSSLYIRGDGSVEKRIGSINFKSFNNSTQRITLAPKFGCIELSKDMDNFNFNNSILITKLKQNLKLNYNPEIKKYIFNFATEETIVNEKIIHLLKEVLEIFDHQYLIFTNNVEYIKQNNAVWYNNNEWILDNCDKPHYSTFIKEIRKADLGTIKKKFIFLNNHFSKVRFDILKLIYKNKKQCEGNISFNLIDFTKRNEGINSEAEFLAECEEYGILYPSYYDTYPTLTQIGEEEVNRNKILGINHIGTVSLNYRIYFEAFFEIITETSHLLKAKGLYTSEKIHKPFKAAVPFVYYGKKDIKNYLEAIGFTFNSPIYFFGEGEEFMNHLEFLLNQDMEWYNKTQKNYLDEYIRNLENYNNSLQRRNNELILNFIYK